MKARKLPIVIDAFKLTREVSAKTLEGTMFGDPGDWMIVGVEGEVYFCKDSVFQKSYELLEDAPKPAFDNVITSYIPTPETQVYVNTHPSPPLKLSPEPEKKLINRTLGGKGYQFVRNAPTLEECFTKFPNVPRANIERTWYNAHAPVKEAPAPEKEEPEKKIVIEPKKGYSKAHNMDAGRWHGEEIAVLLKAVTVVDAIKAYREKFPESVRNDNAVRQKWFKIVPSGHLPPGNPKGKLPKYIKLPEKKTQTPNKTQLGGIVLPDELKPLEEKKSFFVGAQVKQVSGRSPHAMGTGDIIEIKGNGDIVVEFYHERKTLKRDELAFYSPPNQNSVMKVRSS